MREMINTARHFARAMIGLLLLSPVIGLGGQTCEIKFAPGEYVYRLALSEDRRLYDCNIHNISVVNRASKPLKLEHVEVQSLRGGRVAQNRVFYSDELDGRAEKISAADKAGALKDAEKELRLVELFRKAGLSPSSKLEPNSGLLIRNEYFVFSGPMDKIRVLAEGKLDDGTSSKSSAEIALLEYQQKTRFFFPLSGAWYVTGAADPSGEHRWGIGQEFAYDLEKIDADGNLRTGDPNVPQSFYAYGQKVAAPADGTVFDLRDGIDDTPIASFSDTDESVTAKHLREYQTTLRNKYGPRGSDGNYVMIDHGNHEYSVMVHLKKGSLQVQRGDSIKRGQIIAEVGQSGLSTSPHLHFEVVSDPDPVKQRGLPISFSGLEGERDAKFLSVRDGVRRAP